MNGYFCILNLPFDEINFDKNVNLEDVLNTPHDSDIDSFVECHSFCLVNNKQKKNKIIFYEKKRKQMKKENAKQTSKKERKTNTRKHQMLKLCFRHGMIVDKVQETIWITQSKLLEKQTISITQKKSSKK